MYALDFTWITCHPKINKIVKLRHIDTETHRYGDTSIRRHIDTETHFFIQSLKEENSITYNYFAYHGGNRLQVIDVPTMRDTYNSKFDNILKNRKETTKECLTVSVSH